MSRIIIFVVIAALIVFAGFKLLKPKTPTPGTTASPSATTLQEKKTTAQTGKTAGKIKPKTKEEIAEEKQKAQLAERQRQRELRRQKRAEERARRLAERQLYSSQYYTTRRSRTGRRGLMLGAQAGRRGSAIKLYQVRAIFTVENEKFVLIDAIRYAKGDEIIGRKIIDILDDRIIINEYGRTREVKIGESVVPTAIIPKARTLK